MDLATKIQKIHSLQQDSVSITSKFKVGTSTNSMKKGHKLEKKPKKNKVLS